MKIKDILKEKTPHISFEVFPPKTDAGFASVLSATDQIGALKPSYMSVTYGAGGGTSKNTVNIASHIKDDLGLTSLAHLTCVSSTKEHVARVIDELKKNNIENVLALRGDIPRNLNFHFRIITDMHMSWLKRSKARVISASELHAIRKVMWKQNIRKMTFII